MNSSVDLRTAHYNSRNLPACVALRAIEWITSGKSEANTWTTVRTVWLANRAAVRSLWFGEKLVNKIESLVVSDHSVQGFIRKLVCG